MKSMKTKNSPAVRGRRKDSTCGQGRWTASVRKVAVWASAALAVAAFGLACSGTEGGSSKTPRLENRLTGAGILIQSSGDAAVGKTTRSLLESLKRAGYRVVSAGTEHHEVVADIRASLRESKGFLAVVVNGEVKRDYVVDVTVTITGREEGRALAIERLQYDSDDDPDDDDVRRVAAAFGSRAVRTYLLGLLAFRRDASKQQRKEAEEELRQARAAEEQDQRARLQKEDAAWNQLTLASCTEPSRVDGCDALKSFLETFPTGRHATAAKKALETGAPQIAKLIDERDWYAARPDACQTPKLATDCDAVDGYLSAHPTGAHVVEGRALVARAEVKLGAIRKADERRRKEAEAAEAQAQKKEEARIEREFKKEEEENQRKERAECKKECLRNVCFSVRPGAFEICMDRCVKAECE